MIKSEREKKEMNTKKKVIYTPDICPHCQSAEIMPKKEFIKDNYLYIPNYCKTCGKVSKAIYYIEYQETEGWY